jgi:hypothetical protein
MGGNRNLLLSLPRLVLAFGLISLDSADDPIVDEIRPRTVILLIVDMTEPVSKLVIFLLSRRGLLTLVAYLLRTLCNGTLFLVKSLTTSLLQLILICLLALLTRLSRLRLGRSTLRWLLRPALFVSPTLGFRILLCLIWLIGQCGLLWLKRTGRHDRRRMDYQVTTAV